MTTNFSNRLVSMIAVGQSIDLPAATEHFAGRFVVSRYRDALHIDLPKGQAFVFDYGVLICWGVSDQKKQRLIQELASLVNNPQQGQWENYAFEVLEQGNERPGLLFSNDLLTLHSSRVLDLLALSHAFAQACKLEGFEAKAASSIVDNQYLTQKLAEKGKVDATRKQLAKARGTLFQVKSDIMLNFNLLDTPEFFWDHPALESDYQNVCKYLELKPRIELLNLKLQTIHELLDMLATEQNHKHSSFLEWIIIILIAVEIVLYFGH
jgi:uncharacterized Rmd1/YagE family protein